MRGRFTFLTFVVALLAVSALLLAGCGDSNLAGGDPSEVSDEEMLREFVDEDGIFDDLGSYEAGTVAAGGSGSREAIDPLTFWRHVTDRDKNVVVEFDPETGTADVTINRDIWGVLHILDEDMVEYEKNFHHQGVRYATFVRDPDWQPPESTPGGGNGNGGDAPGQQHRFRHGPWELTEISGFVGESDTLTVEFDYVDVQSATADITIDDPLDLLTVPDEIPAFQVGEEVTVTVYGAPDDAILFLHTRFWKSPFEPQGDGTFVGSWTVERPGRHCAWIEGLAHDTIYDSEYPEDSLVWGMPYVVEGDPEEIE
ncbi:MAG: hypothetical protein GF400_02480 [Candidatus Eisenbacteria bacterium]|nr:hypothetical protein [Candidatus Eisenbacteria bacterium]